MPDRSLFISHTGDDTILAIAWKTLITQIDVLPITPVFAADRDANGGIRTGKWRESISEELKAADFLLALFTPESSNKPWIFFESAFALGLGKERTVIPVVFYMDKSAVPSPLSDQETFRGDDRDSVIELCVRLAKDSTGVEASSATTVSWKDFIDQYMDQIDLHKKARLTQELFYGGFHTSSTVKTLQGDQNDKWYAKWTRFVGEAGHEREEFWHPHEISITDAGWRIHMVGREPNGYLTPFEGVVSSQGKIALCYWYPHEASAICGTVLLEMEGRKLLGTWKGYSARKMTQKLSLTRGRVLMSKDRADVDGWGPATPATDGQPPGAASSPVPGS